MDKELDHMVQSMKMLNRTSLNQNQIRTLKEIEDMNTGTIGDEMTSREKQFRNMLSEIKQKSDLMRKRKLNQGSSNRPLQTRGG